MLIRFKHSILFAALGLFLYGGGAYAADNIKEINFKAGGNSGLNVPRFVSLVSNEVNLRTGPGLKYPITWVLVREGLPVEVIREFDAWREIRTIDGDEGWVHQSLLSGRRMGIIHPYIRKVYKDASLDSRPLAEVEPGVIVGIEQCIKNWCEIDVMHYDGWIEKQGLWGAYAHEEFEQ